MRIRMTPAPVEGAAVRDRARRASLTGCPEPTRIVICPFCQRDDDRVVDSRASEGGATIRRRRQCNACEKRFTTYERVEEVHRLMVVKRDGSRTPFSREKILAGIQAACGKRPVPEALKLEIVDLIDDAAHRENDREITSQEIGRRVAASLRDLDEIAYIRFASEHEQFKSVGDILETVRQLGERVKDLPEQQKLFDA